ncbi:Detected protein of unknown function [Hibiscus syriacus]|uniref:Plant bHLH transcription factor ACT-like domain-containing protein n=1 Tax=Hibiscus syriacus TaxID=106335 RepID=A0A6A2ZZ42_HIBSY|nr:uncharacterized protein LOC120137404 [Hibiscus syriacus]KAE8696479.1 Detected protein of unknown function [Hibiscus syriacus]
MVTKLRRRTAVSRRKRLHLMQTNPKSVRYFNKNVVLHFHKLKIKLEELQRECQNLRVMRNEYFTLLKHIQIPKEVKVEKIGEQFVVRVVCSNKGGYKLVWILSAFDELGLDVVRASVSCSHLFSMEAIAEAQGQEGTGIREITLALLKAIDEKQGGEMGNGDGCNTGGVH